jgi:cytochrome c oxidase subunit 3
MSPAAASLEPFDQRGQQHRADMLGMFVFLASEVMLFGGLFTALGAYRALHPDAANEASEHLNLWFGSANTAILLTSSLFVALAVMSAKQGRRRATTFHLGVAVGLGLAFLVVKGFEYRLDFSEGVTPTGSFGAHPATLFISLYFVSTALHAIHVGVGVALLGGVAIGAGRGRLELPRRAGTVELAGLYWHLVDVIWIFLFPLLYLARP